MFLIVGGDSEIGAATYRAMKAQGVAVAATTRRRDRVAPDRPFLDLAAPLDDWAPPPGTQAVCLCAAIARLAACADDPQGSAHINVVQTLALAEKLLARGIAVLFLSTNQVFDGRTPHERAEAPHSPVSEYGRQKARAEAALLRQMESGAPVAILRLAKVVSDTMPLIGGWIKDLTAARPIRVFNDLHWRRRRPIWSAPRSPPCCRIAPAASFSSPDRATSAMPTSAAFSPPILTPTKNWSPRRARARPDCLKAQRRCIPRLIRACCACITGSKCRTCGASSRWVATNARDRVASPTNA